MRSLETAPVVMMGAGAVVVVGGPLKARMPARYRQQPVAGTFHNKDIQ
jgi:hypothetical protein